MTTDEALVPADVVDKQRRNAALLRAIGLDRVPEEQRSIAIAIATKYELDLLLKHLVLIDGRPFVTRDGLLHIAHRSGVLDGIEVVEDPHIVTLPGLGEFWQARVRVWRKDWSKPVEMPGRYPTRSGNVKYGPEMALKNAESMAYRRAFNISAPTVDEKWDLATVQADVDAVSTPQQPARTLRERVQERVASMGPLSSGSAGPSPDEDPEVTQSMGVRRLEEEAAVTLDDLETCGEEDPSPMALGTCDELPGHKGPHKSEHGTWPR